MSPPDGSRSRGPHQRRRRRPSWQPSPRSSARTHDLVGQLSARAGSTRTPCAPSCSSATRATPPPRRSRGTSGLTSGAVTNMIDRMTAAGLLERAPNPADRRGSLLRLLPAGEAVVETTARPVRRDAARRRRRTRWRAARGAQRQATSLYEQAADAVGAAGTEPGRDGREARGGPAARLRPHAHYGTMPHSPSSSRSLDHRARRDPARRPAHRRPTAARAEPPGVRGHGGVYVGLALVFAVLMLVFAVGDAAGQFVAGWLTEYSLSIDNLFVFVIIMARSACRRRSSRRC